MVRFMFCSLYFTKNRCRGKFNGKSCHLIVNDVDVMLVTVMFQEGRT